VQRTYALIEETHMLKHLASKLIIGAALLSLVTPAALALTGTDPEPGLTGTDPEPGVVLQVILTYLGLA
jgi:hypothetical protein